MALILLIEDEKILRENTQELLQIHGHECITAIDGKEGIEIARKMTPDMIICDIMLPHTNGYDVKRELNKHEETVNMPFVFLTARSEREDLRKGMDLGAADFITKPFKIIELINSIDRRLVQSNYVKKNIISQVADSLENFIHIAKHECNTPLHAIINLSEIILTSEDQDSPKELISAINTSGKRLHKTLNNLIDLVHLRHYSESKLENKEQIEISQVIEQNVNRIKKLYEQSINMNLKTKLIESSQFIYEHLNTLFSELTDNAFKFSKPGGTVTIQLKVSQDKKQLLFQITNQLAEPVFLSTNEISPFKKCDDSLNQKSGSGLGLYLSRLICENYYGSLIIENKGDLSLSIKVTLPLKHRQFLQADI